MYNKNNRELCCFIVLQFPYLIFELLIFLTLFVISFFLSGLLIGSNLTVELIIFSLTQRIYQVENLPSPGFYEGKIYRKCFKTPDFTTCSSFIGYSLFLFIKSVLDY